MLLHLKGVAILVVPVGAVLGLGRAYPDLGADRYLHLYMAAAFAAASVASAAQGIRSRLLFLPTWFVGLGAVCFAFAQLGGAWWVAAVIGGLVTLFAGLIALGVADERAQLAQAPERLLEAKDAALREDWPSFWKAVERSFFAKSSALLPSEVNTHDLKVLALVSSQLQAAEQPRCLSLVREKLDAGARAQAAQTAVDPKALAELKAWLKAKTRAPTA